MSWYKFEHMRKLPLGIILKFGVALIAAVVFSACQQKSNPLENAEIQLNRRVIYPRFRENPKPAGSVLARTNPPVMLCPLSGNGPMKYSFRLSQDEQFPEGTTITQENLRYAIFNVHKELGNGTWHWQFKSEKSSWSAVNSFEVTDKVPVFETPSPNTLIGSVPVAHPRVLVNPDELPAFLGRVAKTPDAQAIIEAADTNITKLPPEESVGISKPGKNFTKAERRKLALDASKRLGSRAGAPVELFCQAYVLSGEEKYAKAAILWANKIAGYDPNGVSMTNNFGDSELMLVMAMTYDVCYDLLTEKEKEALLTSIQVRGNRFYDRWTNMLEAKIFSGHIWQHILERLFKTSLATLHDIPEASHWLTYVYEVWLARAPCLGPDDGGWWHGNHYMELNTLTLLDIPLYLKQYTGIDYFRSPWYQNNAFWLIYSFPANSYSEGFGNGTEKQFGQKLGMLGYTDVLSRLTGNPYASWYSGHQLDAMSKSLSDDDEFRWFRLKWILPDRPSPISELDLPLARVFPETGTVNMHTDMTEASHNLMVSMRSSPYGSSGHAHSDQNSFNIQYGGEKLFYNSGYRPSMGVPHYEEWFKASIGHNTVLIDGKGQPIGSSESYGWMPRFIHGKRISYSLGDASNAYDNQNQVPQTAGLKRFRRHLIFLRPATVVIYDELEADHDAEWDWLIHSHEEIQLDVAQQQIRCETKAARSQVNFFGSQKLDMSLSTEFDPKPRNFRGLRDENGNLVEYKDQWHIYAKSEGKTSRYLAIFQVRDINDSSPFEQPAPNGQGIIHVGNWSIHAEMDVSSPASFEITHSEGDAKIAYGKTKISLGKQELKAHYRASTLLIEDINGEVIAREAVDVAPVGRD